MDQSDPSIVVLQITALNNLAIAALKNPHNEKFFIPSARPDIKPSSRRSRETTPLMGNELVRAELRTDRYPYEPLLGWVFGSNKKTCDFYLGDKEKGVSERQFCIDHNWKAKTLVLENISDNGTKWINPSTGHSERFHNSRTILPGHQYYLIIGYVEVILRIPSRSKDQQALYDDRIQSLGKEVEEAVPEIDGLKVHTAGVVTPMVIGEKRKFALQQIIGQGATAIVHKAVDLVSGDVFAAKEYNINEDADSVVSIMINEIKILQKLHHQNIIKYTDVFKDPAPILIMELAHNSLADVKFLLVSDCVTLLKHTLAGLAYLHEEKIIHRDIKPANILFVGEESVWKLSDFGLSKTAENTTTFLGTPLYLAPEMGGLKHSVYTAAIDVWATGVVATEYTSGLPSHKLIKHRKNRSEWDDAVIAKGRESPIAPIINHMLVTEPSKRASAASLIEALEKWANDDEEDHEIGVQLTEISDRGLAATFP